MQTDEFIKSLEDNGHERAGLCMFVPAVLVSIARRLLGVAYGESDGGLSVKMCSTFNERKVRYRAGNYSSANLVHAANSIDALKIIPGAVILIAASGVGASKAKTFGLLMDGQLEKFEDREHSFYSFAEEFLSVGRCNEEVQLSSLGDIEEILSGAEKFYFGTHDEIKVRRGLLKAFHDLEAIIASEGLYQRQGGLGHNKPPPDLTLSSEITHSITLNVHVLRSQVQSGNPDPQKVVKSVRKLQAAGEEIVEFFYKTAEHLKSDGSRALAGALITAIGYSVWNVMKWISIVLGSPIF